MTADKRVPLSVLTMPSLEWTFERCLIHDREHGRGRTWPRYTFITAVERSPFIYQAALARMPGAEDGLSCAVTVPPFATAAVKTRMIQRYFRCELAGLAEHQRTTDHWFDAAWIDLTGPLSFAYMDTLMNLWRRVRSLLVVTSLRARWATDFSAAVADAGGLADLLMDDLPGSVAIANYDYADTSPMSQISLRRLVSP